eukprot:symbB.v1.2.038101.t1/scaffold5823.1/size23319/2
MKVCPPVAMVHVAILGSLLLGLAKSDGVVVQEVNSYGEPSAVVIASDGLPIVAGNSNAASQAGDFAGSASYGSADVVVIKYTLAGAQSATYKVGTTSQDAAEAMEIDSSDNIFVSGWSFGGFDEFTSAGKEDVFILKLDSSLSKVWLIQFGTTGSDYAVAIGLDSSGNVIVGGKTEGTWPDKDLVGGYDAWISLFNSTGDQQWILQFGSTAYDDLMDLAVDTVDSVDMIYATGYTQGNFEGGTHAGGQDDDPFLIKVSSTSSSGSKVWSVQVGGTGRDRGYGVVVDSAHNAYIAGQTNGVVATGTSQIGSDDLFLMKYNQDGEQQWVKQLGSGSAEGPRSLGIDGNGNIYPGLLTQGVLGSSNFGDYDTAVMQVDSSGTVIWTEQFGTSKNDFPIMPGGVVVDDSTGDVFFAGQTQGSFSGYSNTNNNYNWFLYKIDHKSTTTTSSTTATVSTSTSSTATATISSSSTATATISSSSTLSTTSSISSSTTGSVTSTTTSSRTLA